MATEIKKAAPVVTGGRKREEDFDFISILRQVNAARSAEQHIIQQLDVRNSYTLSNIDP